MLQALVGSSRIAHGTLQPYFFADSSCTALPRRLALMMKFWKKALRTPGSSSKMRRIS